MKKKNKIYKISIDASCDCCSIFDTENIPDEIANEIFNYIYNNHEINEVSCDDYIGETVYISGTLGGTKAKMTKIQRFYDDKKETIYKSNISGDCPLGYSYQQITQEAFLKILTTFIDNKLAETDVYKHMGCLDLSDYHDIHEMYVSMEQDILSWEIDICLHYTVDKYFDETIYDVTIPKRIWNSNNLK